MHIYTVVIHNLKKKFNLTFCEYCVMETIDYLSKDENYCYKSKVNIGNDLNFSAKSVSTSIKKLVQKKLVEKDENNAQNLKATEKWRSAKGIFTEEISSFFKPPKNFFPQQKEKNGIINRKKNHDKEKKFPTKEKKIPTRILKNKEDTNKNIIRTDIDDFI